MGRVVEPIAHDGMGDGEAGHRSKWRGTPSRWSRACHRGRSPAAATAVEVVVVPAVVEGEVMG
jgi:hypothetical protein